jgi:hypothetical protein
MKTPIRTLVASTALALLGSMAMAAAPASSAPAPASTATATNSQAPATTPAKKTVKKHATKKKAKAAPKKDQAPA